MSWFLRDLRAARTRTPSQQEIRDLILAFVVNLPRFNREATPAQRTAVMLFMDSTLHKPELQDILPASDASFLYVKSVVLMWKWHDPRPPLDHQEMQYEYEWLRYTPHGPIDTWELRKCEYDFYMLNHPLQ